MNLSIADLRRDYTARGLSEDEIDLNPFQQFQAWFDQALAAQLPEPNAMTLATATPEGVPSARIVLLKGLDARGFVFYTNYQSRKGRELTNNAHAALIFWWAELERQVRIEGQVTKVSDQETEAYFHSRPISSQLGAWASNQSRVIENRAVLEQRMEDLKAQYQDQTIPRPPHWGGYRVTPRAIEFWQGRPSRLHDRILYTLAENGSWVTQRLSP